MPRPAPDITVPPPRRSPALTGAVTLALAGITTLVGLLFFGKISLMPATSRAPGAVFYVVPYLYGFAFYDRDFREVERMEVRQGEEVTLYIVSAHALAEETFLAYAERSVKTAIGGLPAGDPQIRNKIAEDLALGNIEHIIGISAHAVYVTTDVTKVLDGKRFRAGAPKDVAEAVRRKDPTIKQVTFTAKRVGLFDVLCVDSGMDGASTCGWAHKQMVTKGGFVVGK